MKCPKCGYTSFDYLRECKKCGENLEESRQALNLKIGEATLFVGLKEKISEPVTVVKSDLSSKSSTVSSEQSNYFTSSSDFAAADEPPSKKTSEDITSGLGSLSDMEKEQPRANSKPVFDDLPDITLEESLSDLEGLELTPSFNDSIKSAPSPVERKKAEFDLFDDEEIPETVSPVKGNTPFEFSESALDSEMDLLQTPSSISDKDLIELELDMEDEESLDQILADLQAKE